MGVVIEICFKTHGNFEDLEAVVGGNQKQIWAETVTRNYARREINKVMMMMMMMIFFFFLKLHFDI